MCKLGLHISSAAGTPWVCACAQWSAGYWHGVFVCLHRLCVRMYLWVCIPLPLVFLMSKTLTSSEKRLISSPARYHPKLFQISFERGIFCADYCSGRLEHNCMQSVKISTTQTPSASSSHIRRLKFLACSCIWVSLLWSAYQGSSEWARSEQPPKQGNVLWPNARTREPTHIQTEALKKNLTCRVHTARGTMGLRHVLPLGYFYMNELSLLSKRTEQGYARPTKKAFFFLYFCICMSV